jgi:hypothetical protein
LGRVYFSTGIEKEDSFFSLLKEVSAIAKNINKKGRKFFITG